MSDTKINLYRQLRRKPIPKPTEQDKAGFRALVPVDPSVVITPMFGNLGAFVNGNMLAGGSKRVAWDDWVTVHAADEFGRLLLDFSGEKQRV